MTYRVAYHPEAGSERDGLSSSERVAIANAVEKLEEFGPALPFPHQSAVKGVAELRELRPRAPEAETNRRGFRKSIRAAERRLDEIEV